MTKDEILIMVQHCWPGGPREMWCVDGEFPRLERFAVLVAEKEREACAKLCENNSASYSERASRPEKVRDINPEVARVAVQTCGHVAAAIRARGEIK
jgi:hypothetical protein